jgi:hypothetical protein
MRRPRTGTDDFGIALAAARAVRPLARAAAAAAASSVLWFAAADAAVIQSAFVFHDTLAGPGQTDRQMDLVFGVTAADIDRDAFAQFGLPGAYQAAAAVGRFGSVGVSAGAFESGVSTRLFAEVFVASDEFVNVTGQPQQASVNFVIDGGSALLVAGR